MIDDYDNDDEFPTITSKEVLFIIGIIALIFVFACCYEDPCETQRCENGTVSRPNSENVCECVPYKPPRW